MTENEILDIRSLLLSKPIISSKLYAKGFLITDKGFQIENAYPFYSNWDMRKVGNLYFYLHKDTRAVFHSDGIRVFFFIGHAVDPYSKLYQEDVIIEKLAKAYRSSYEEYYSSISDLTGVFCTGIVEDDGITLLNDCAGMQIVYYGCVQGSICVTSHSKLAGDLFGLKQTDYIQRLVSSRFYHYMGTWLPGDLSPYRELLRLVPNHTVFLDTKGKANTVRFFPTEPIIEETEQEQQDTIEWLANTVHSTLELYSKKWSDKNVAISVTGGKDSTTTLACVNGLHDKFSYFSYISNEAEQVDAIAAKSICDYLGLPHSIYIIPKEESAFETDDYNAFSYVLECNAGCIGKNNPNDIRKRLFFIQNNKFDIEIKSWVNELGRGSQYIKYNIKRFPNKPKASYCRTLHKIYVSPRMIHETDKVFSDYLNKYYSEDVFEKAPWMELFWWEFCWSGGEGIFLTAEQRVSSEIAIPFNNRRYVARMLSIPLEKRKKDFIPKGIIEFADNRINECGVEVKNLKHTNRRAFLMRMYLEVFSRIKF